MERSWIVDCKGIATKVKSASLSPAHQLKDCGAHRKCPKCRHVINNRDVSEEWPGLPAGVKFDPSDLELLEHLAAKCGVGNYEPHMFIDEFIPTVDEEGGICYAHPEDLPGARKDGSCLHFFHRTSNAYASGQRKRRKIQKNENDVAKDGVRWHKTGKTKPIVENREHKGYKKIMVLYKITKKSSKPDKADWVMHQYHLGTNEDEPQGQFVVSKIFYQLPRQIENNGKISSDFNVVQTSPRTPKTVTPNPARPGFYTPNDDVSGFYAPRETGQEIEKVTPHHCSSVPEFNDQIESQTWLAGESQANDFDESLLCDENFNPNLGFDDCVLNDVTLNSFGPSTNDTSGPSRNAISGISDLENLEFDTPPDFHLTDLPFGSQENIFSWLDRL